MTTQATTQVQQGKKGLGAQVAMTAATLAVLGGAVLWQVRPGDHGSVPAMRVTVGATGEGAAPVGGMAERYREQARAAAEREAGAPTMGGMAELYGARAAEVAAIAELEGRIGGMAELYRYQAQSAGGGW